MRKRMRPEEKFALFVDRSGGPDACWPWIGLMQSMGYGHVGKNMLSHRYTYMVSVGPIPEGMQVNHCCPGRHNRACCNPKHLYLGTQKENRADCIAQGTLNVGERNGRSRFTEADIIEMRTRYRAGEKVKALAAVYGANPGTISQIVQRLRWKHLP